MVRQLKFSVEQWSCFVVRRQVSLLNWIVRFKLEWNLKASRVTSLNRVFVMCQEHSQSSREPEDEVDFSCVTFGARERRH